MIADSRFPRTPRCLIATIGHTLKVEQVTKGQGPLGNDGATGVSQACPERSRRVQHCGGRAGTPRRSASKPQRFSTATYFCG